MSHKGVAAVTAAFLVLAMSARAEDYPGAKIVALGKGQIAFEKDGKTERLSVSPTMKVYDDKGKEYDAVTGVRFLAKDNIVDIKTATDKKLKKEVIMEIKFVSGTVADFPKTGKNINLRPDANFSGKPVELRTSDAVWQAYIATAKVGDFTEYKRGNDEEPGRQETIECGPDFAVVAKVEYLFGKRTEMRTKFMLPAGAKPPADSGPKSGSKNTEDLTVGDKKVTCEVRKEGKSTTWLSAAVPFDGVVKVDSKNYRFVLTDFGRGEK